MTVAERQSPERRASYETALQFAMQQVDALVTRSPDYFPIYTRQGVWRHGGELWTDWTGGFLTGMLWTFAKRDPQGPWRKRAEHYSQLLEHRQHDRQVHDLGFIFLNSYLPWYQISGEPRHQAVVIQAGRTLAMRFDEQLGCLHSFLGPDSLFIDIMMNVPIVFYAALATGDFKLLDVAWRHCRTTRERLVRGDGSTAHEGMFDRATGAFLGQSTQQGLAADSTWSRGLAWSLYGFTQAGKLTGSDELLAVAHRNAACWLTRLPADSVPYWDFDADLAAPLPLGPQRDSSAAAIAASGLLLLAQHSADQRLADQYVTCALAMLDALVEPEYLAIQTPGWEGVLRHGVYHLHKNLGVDESVMWGDHFFVEALDRALTMGVV